MMNDETVFERAKYVHNRAKITDTLLSLLNEEDGEVYGKFVDIEPLPDSHYDERVFGLYIGKFVKHDAAHRIYVIDNNHNHGPDTGVIKEIAICGIPLYYDEEMNREVVKTMTVKQLNEYAVIARRMRDSDKKTQAFTQGLMWEGAFSALQTFLPKPGEDLGVGCVIPMVDKYEKNGRFPAPVISLANLNDERFLGISLVNMAESDETLPSASEKDFLVLPREAVENTCAAPNNFMLEMLYGMTFPLMRFTVEVVRVAQSGQLQEIVDTKFADMSPYEVKKAIAAFMGKKA